MLRVKICGLTRAEDARWALEAGADALGFNFVPGYPRRLEIERAASLLEALPPFGVRVGVFAGADPAWVEEVARRLGLDAVQLHGSESPEECRRLRASGFRVLKAFRVRGRESLKAVADYPDVTPLLDAYREDELGGTGRPFAWALAREVGERRPFVLAGGLTPENVAEAVSVARPYAVDVSSGVEVKTGVKDPERVRAFIARAKGWE